MLKASGIKLSRRAFGSLFGAALVYANADKSSGQTSLFNGRDLTGWSVREGPDSAFYVQDDAIVGSPTSDYPAWLASDREYENFDLQLEFFLKGWNDGGVYLHAPEHGRPSLCGTKINIFHQVDKTPQPNSMGAIFPLIAPSRADVHKTGEWNRLRILADWPRLQVWVNDILVQDADVSTNPELSRRLRHGRIGLVTLSYPLRFRNIRIRELPSKLEWISLYAGPADMAKWFVSETHERAPVRFEPYGAVLHADGLGHIATKELYRDFELEMYIRGARRHNGGVLFRSAGKGLADPRHYEIQLHDVPEAHYPTGSLYYYKRSLYRPLEDEQWYLFQLSAKGRTCWVRINGETVLEYDSLKDVGEGHIELQAHQAGRWLEFKRVQIRKL